MMRRERVRVWDPAVRIGHWLLVVLFAAAYASGEGDSALHVYAGYGVLAVVAFRFLWGLVGTRYARFSGFLRGPRATLSYLKSFAQGRPAHFVGHNPAGGWMIVILLTMLALVSWTGLETYGAQGYGPLAQGGLAPALVQASDTGPKPGKRRRSSSERFWKELHEGFANATLLLVLLHVAGAVVSSIVHRENLVRAMWTGDKLSGPQA
jgi:cytochrome b